MKILECLKVMEIRTGLIQYKKFENCIECGHVVRSERRRKMDILSMGQTQWNEAYKNRGNILFYPHEEIIRFVNKYVRKRIGITDFKNIMQLTDSEWEKFASLDLGCGIGRHMKFLSEFGLNPHGIDLSSGAIDEGRKWMYSMEKPELADKMQIGRASCRERVFITV